MTRTAPLSPFPILDDAELAGKRVLIRVDLNVPMDGDKIADATRIDRILPNLQEISAKGAKVIILSHLGRPKGREEKYSLRPVVAELSARLGKPVAFAADCVGPEAEKAVDALNERRLSPARKHPLSRRRRKERRSLPRCARRAWRRLRQ